jgi:hypothetical protein
MNMYMRLACYQLLPYEVFRRVSCAGATCMLSLTSVCLMPITREISTLEHMHCLPAVKYGRGPDGMHVELVDIAERPVVARYYGLGHINASTRLYAATSVQSLLSAYRSKAGTLI